MLKMIEYALWLAVILMIASSVTGLSNRFKPLIGGIGWGVFAIHWAYQPLHYIEIHDYFNVILTIAISLFCLFMASTMIKEYRQTSRHTSGNDVVYMATTATALGSLFYFPFANLPVLNQWIISTVTGNVVWALETLGFTVETPAWDTIVYNGYSVKIILACTAIESIALFTGLIISVNAPVKRLASAFMVSVPVIYGLNVLRDVFVIIAYGQQWFGADSFEIAHHVIAKIGSAIALFVIAYIVMRILPEILDLIDGLWEMTSVQVRRIINR